MNAAKRIKSLVALLLSSVIVLNFTGCSKKTSENEAEASTSAAEAVTEEAETTSQASSTTKGEKKYYNPLTGLDTISKSAQGKRPWAIVVENSPAARPQWGISTADILVEGIAEGGVTRTLLLYADSKNVPKIGPLRSARHDFVEISQCFDSIFVHCGWSIYAKAKIENEGIKTLNGIFGYSVPFFKRDPSRTGRGIEHSGYTTGSLISACCASLGYRTEIKDGYQNPLPINDKNSPVTPSQGGCSALAFSFSNGNEHVMKYKDGNYFDYLGSSARVDAEGRQLNYKNVLVLYCPVTPMGDSVGCVDMALESSNTGYFFSNGGYESVSWTRTGYSADSRLVINNSAGERIALNAGRTYIALVPLSQKGTTKIQAK